MSSNRLQLGARLSTEGFFLPCGSSGRTGHQQQCCRGWQGQYHALSSLYLKKTQKSLSTVYSSVPNYRVLSTDSKKEEHDLYWSSLSSFKAQLVFLVCGLLGDSQQHSSLSYCLSLEQIKDANGEAAGLLGSYPLASKTYPLSRGEKVAKLLLKLGKNGLQSLVGLFRDLKWD